LALTIKPSFDEGAHLPEIASRRCASLAMTRKIFSPASPSPTAVSVIAAHPHSRICRGEHRLQRQLWRESRHNLRLQLRRRWERSVMKPVEHSVPDPIALEESHSAHNYAPLPVVLARGEGAYLWDVDGKRYVDMMSAYSAASHGHAHPRILRALTEQAKRLAVPSRAYYNDRLGPFLAELCRITGLDRALPMNTGAEAVETAIKAARRWGYRLKHVPYDWAEIIVADGNFHGRTTTIVGFSSEAAYRDGFGPFAPGFRSVPYGDLAAVERAIKRDTVAVLIEPIQGEAGIIVPPDGYLAGLRRLCDAHRVLLIVDEVQSGLGRTGTWFAVEHEKVVPDAMILGKALGGGVLPVSALVGKRELMDVFTPGSHGSTFGGNALAAAVGLEAIRVIADEGLVERSRVLGAHMLERLRAIESPALKAVRGRGLWVGAEIEPACTSARDVCERLLVKGVLSKETHDTVVRLAPPLTIAREDLDWALDRFAEVIADVETLHQPAAA
jgi:ornithine--oxo-acid transaminase